MKIQDSRNEILKEASALRRRSPPGRSCPGRTPPRPAGAARGTPCTWPGSARVERTLPLCCDQTWLGTIALV